MGTGLHRTTSQQRSEPAALDTVAVEEDDRDWCRGDKDVQIDIPNLERRSVSADQSGVSNVTSLLDTNISISAHQKF